MLHRVIIPNHDDGAVTWSPTSIVRLPQNIIRIVTPTCSSPQSRPHPPSQGESIGMRLAPGDSDDVGEYVQGMLHFDDGGMRGLACALVWCGMMHHGQSIKDEEFVSPSMADLARSLLQIPTFYKSQTHDEAADMIRRIVKQNVDAKKQSVSSYEWSLILRGLLSSASRKATSSVSMQEAIELYNANPEVAAHGGTSKD